MNYNAESFLCMGRARRVSMSHSRRGATDWPAVGESRHSRGHPGRVSLAFGNGIGEALYFPLIICSTGRWGLGAERLDRGVDPATPASVYVWGLSKSPSPGRDGE
jgi:hypothetical protein